MSFGDRPGRGGREMKQVLASFEWAASAACAGRTTLFFAEDAMSSAIACAICRRCPVQEACEADARSVERPWQRYGVVAGFTAAERRSWDR